LKKLLPKLVQVRFLEFAKSVQAFITGSAIVAPYRSHCHSNAGNKEFLMRKPGRPKSDRQPYWKLERITLVLHGYQRARENGEKHVVAVKEAVEFVMSKARKMPISETEVKRI
jgi:hypothetical protein